MGAIIWRYSRMTDRYSTKSLLPHAVILPACRATTSGLPVSLGDLGDG